MVMWKSRLIHYSGNIFWNRVGKTGGHFPTLYKVNQIYDKREVVICFLMVMQFSLKEADEFLRAVSFNEQNYDNRELYPLHYK